MLVAAAAGPRFAERSSTRPCGTGPMAAMMGILQPRSEWQAPPVVRTARASVHVYLGVVFEDGGLKGVKSASGQNGRHPSE